MSRIGATRSRSLASRTVLNRVRRLFVRSWSSGVTGRRRADDFLPGPRERLSVGVALIVTPITALDITIHPPVMPLQPNGSASAPPGGQGTDLGMPSGWVRIRPARSVDKGEPCSSGMITDLSGLRELRSSRRHPRSDGAAHDPADAERNRPAPRPVKTTAFTLCGPRSPLREIRTDLREIGVVGVLASRFAPGSPLTPQVPHPI